MTKFKKVPLEVVTITDILETINKQYGEITALRIKAKDGVFRTLSYVGLGRRAVDLSSTLIKLGVVKNDRVAILSESRPEWSIAFFGIVSCGAIIVPIDVKLTEKEIQFILSDSQTKCVILSSKYLDAIDSMRNSLPDLKHIILFDHSERKDVILLEDLKMKEGEQKYHPIHPQDTAIMVYTSGTIGVAKGVELTYDNLMFQVRALSDIIHYTDKDQFLSILPLNHMLEITGGLIAPLYAGSCITYANTIKTTTLISLMKETHTTNMICVPLVLKMLHDGIMERIARMPLYKQKLFFLLLNISKFLLKLNIRIGRFIFVSVHKEFGGNLRCFVSGGAPLNIDAEVNMNALGFRILQGYGLTETAPVITVNTFKDNRFGSVGKPLPGVEVKILKESENMKDGEIVTRGPHLMKGYYRNPEKTAEVIKDGWLHTGDIGYMDKDGFLFISGRARNLIVLGAGKKVFPEEVEEVLGKSPFIKEICVVGKIASKGVRRGCEEVYAVVVPNLDNFEGKEKEDKELIKNKISSEINKLSADLAEYKRVTGFDIWFDELPKTATKKIRRKVVADAVAVSSQNAKEEL